MSFTIHVNIVNHEEQVFDGLVTSIIAPAVEGDVGIWPRHHPFISPLRTGEIILNLPAGDKKFYYVSGGFIEVQPHVVNVLADSLVRGRDIDAEAAQQAKENAEQTLASQQVGTIEYKKALADLEDSQMRLRVLKHLQQNQPG